MENQQPPLSEKDVWPNRDIFRDDPGNVGQKIQVQWATPGLNFLEYTTVEMAKGLAVQGGHVLADHDIALRAFSLAKAVIARLEAGHIQPLPDEDD